MRRADTALSLVRATIRVPRLTQGLMYYGEPKEASLGKKDRDAIDLSNLHILRNFQTSSYVRILYAGRLALKGALLDRESDHKSLISKVDVNGDKKGTFAPKIYIANTPWGYTLRSGISAPSPGNWGTYSAARIGAPIIVTANFICFGQEFLNEPATKLAACSLFIKNITVFQNQIPSENRAQGCWTEYARERLVQLHSCLRAREGSLPRGPSRRRMVGGCCKGTLGAAGHAESVVKQRTPRLCDT